MNFHESTSHVTIGPLNLQLSSSHLVVVAERRANRLAFLRGSYRFDVFACHLTFSGMDK